MDVCTEVKRKRRLGLVFPFERKKGRVVKKQKFGRHVQENRVLGWHFALHATKGWRQESVKRAAARMWMAERGYGR